MTKYKKLQKIVTNMTKNCYKSGSDKRTNKRKQNKQSVSLLYDINYHYLNSHLIIIIS